MNEQQGGKLFLQNLNKKIIGSEKFDSLEAFLDLDIMKSLQKLEKYETTIIYYLILRYDKKYNNNAKNFKIYRGRKVRAAK